MTKKALLLLLILILFFSFLLGCNVVKETVVYSPTPDLAQTIQWMVDDAVMKVSTQIMYQVGERLKTLESTPFIPVRSETPIGYTTMLPPVTKTALSCQNLLSFVKDVSIPDNTAVEAGKPFTKTWQIRNAGTCDWNENYCLSFDHGDQMGANDKTCLPGGVIIRPDETIEISVYMIAPEKKGFYAGYWLMEDEQSVSFGSGKNHDKAIWVKVEVR